MESHCCEHVTAVKFRRGLFGYRRAAVDDHLQAVGAWSSALRGAQQALEARREELEAEIEGHLRDAEADAVRIIEDARREAQEIAATARREADGLVTGARHEAEIAGRAPSRNGGPVGNDWSFAHIARLRAALAARRRRPMTG